MATIQQKGEAVRKAVKWISENIKEGKNRPVSLIIMEAAGRYNLSPKEEAFIREFYEK
ncbi:hypothetical protein ACFL2O_07605 [Thermodesulfobacteriota bacterium]